jgi:hypothetical protein
MNIASRLQVTAIGLALSSVAFAQSPPPAPAPPPPAAGATASTPVAPRLAFITQSSRVRAFNPRPDGEVRSLYLQNGSVIDVTPGLGGQLGSAIRKGAKITVTGRQLEINGQSVVEAASIRLNDQTFAANPASAVQVTPPPGAPPAPPAPASRKNKAAASAPCEVPPDAPPPPPDWGDPPPPPDGLAPPPPPPDAMGPPPPPPPQG